jgi:hypothetical protein
MGSEYPPTPPIYFEAGKSSFPDCKDIVLPAETVPKKEPIIEIDYLKTESTKSTFISSSYQFIQQNKPKPINQKLLPPKINWNEIIGYLEIKRIIDAVITTSSKKKTHLLISGAPGTSKTVFLKTIEESLKKLGLNVHYLDATTLSSAGVIEYLFANDVKYALIDELDKLEKEHQKVFLNLLESSIIQETKGKKGGIRRKEMKDTIFICTANYIEKIMVPLLTRFLSLNIPKYTKEQFYQIGCELLETQYNKTKEIAYYIVDSIWNIYTQKRNEEPNLRQCVQVSILTDNDKATIDPILYGIAKYSRQYEE